MAKKYKAKYLGDDQHEDWLALGDTKPEIEKRAREAGINPANLQWEDISSQPKESMPPQTAQEVSSEMGKQVYQSGKDLFYPTDTGFKRIKDPQELKELSSTGFLDTSKGYASLPGQEKAEPIKDIEIPDTLTPDDFQAQTLDLSSLQQQIFEGQQEQQKSLQELISNISKGFQPPTMEKSYVEQYQELVENAGIEDLQTRLQDVRDELQEKQILIRGEELSLQERLNKIEDKPVQMGIITGEKAAAQKERELVRSREQLELQTLALEEQSLASRIQAEQTAISTVMNLKQMDFEEAKAEVETAYRRNIDIVNMTSQLYDRNYRVMQDALTFMNTQQQFQYQVEQNTKNNNQALFQTVLESIQEQGTTWNNLSNDNKQKIDNLAFAAGLPSGIGEFLLNKATVNGNIKSSNFIEDTGQTIITYKDGRVEIAEAPEGYNIPEQDLDYKTKVKTEIDLANKFESYAKESRQSMRGIKIIKEGYAQVQEIIEQGGGSLNAPSQAILVTFQKMLDPTSVVRESEYARSGEGLSLKQQLMGKYEKLIKGGAGVSAQDLSEFVTISERLLSIYSDQMLNFAKRTKTQANNYGLNLENILTPDVLDMLNEIDGFDDPLGLGFKGTTEDDPLGLGFNLVGGDTNQASNLPQRNFNPGNIKTGGLADKYAIGTDEQGHLIFPNEQTGFRALKEDLKAKIEGRSQWIKEENPTLKELGNVWAEDPNWANAVANMLEISVNTKTKSIDFNKLLSAVARQEGYYA